MSVYRYRAPRICFVGPENLPALAPEFSHLPMGGAQLQQTLLAKGLIERGFDVSMVVADLGQPDGATWDGIATLRAYPPHGGLPGLRFFHPRLSRVWSAMHRAQADLYYCSCAGLLPGQLALYSSYTKRRVKTVFRMAHDRDARPEELLIPNWRGKALYRYGLARMDLILAQTANQQVEMQRNFGLPSRVVRSLVQLPNTDPEPSVRDIDLLWVSNLRLFKRPEMFIDLAAALSDRVAHMAGGTQPGQESYYATLRARAATVSSLTFHGAVSFAETNRLLDRARLLLNTSETEGFPNTYLQAWARGVPVIGTFDPDGVISREGVGIAVRTTDELVDAARSLLADPGRWNELSRRSRAYVEREHGAGALDEYAASLRELLGNPA